MVKIRGNLEKRKYIRLDSVFPVDFRIVSQDKQTLLTDWIQGFTSNISSGGICLSVNNLNPEFAKFLEEEGVGLLLNIQVPLNARATPARARRIWIKAIGNEPGRYIIGLAYSEISPQANRRIVRYARMKYYIPRVSAALVITLALSVGISGYFNWRLTKENRNLVSQLVQILGDSRIAKETIGRISKEKEELNSRLTKIQAQIKNAEEEKKQLSEMLNQLQLLMKRKEADEGKAKENIQELTLLIGQLNEEKNALTEQLANLKNKEEQAAKELLLLDERKIALQQATFDNVYQWLVRHQNPRSGLILSFEGDRDIDRWAFTYDQALAACAYTYFNDFKKAQKIFNFFEYRAQKQDGGFINAYYADDGKPAEYMVHCGPNIWLGIAILQYTQKAQDKSYLNLVGSIADWIIQMQDEEGGIRGGPRIKWYSTEHNLDAYALFDMLYKMTGNQRYEKGAQRVLDWLLMHTYDRPDVPIRRGKGDSTIATDTYAWSIATLGPAKLEELEMSTDDIMQFAEDNCSVEVDYSRPNGNTIKVKGFDFAAQRNLARGGVVSCEWTAQMVLAFKIMEKFYREKQMFEPAKKYQDKADDYLWHLSRMIISSPSASGQGQCCLPYASSDFIDTGHGWMTPKGSLTGSVAGTAYTLFAYYGYNPLKFINNNYND